MLDDTIRNNVSFGMADPDDDKVWHALEEAQLVEFFRNNSRQSVEFDIKLLELISAI